MDQESEIRANTRDIAQLTNNLTRIATMVEHSEKRRDADMEVVKTALVSIERLNERMSATLGMEKDVSELRQEFAKRYGDFRALSHDVKNVVSGMEAIKTLDNRLNKSDERITKIECRADELEKWKGEAAALLDDLAKWKSGVVVTAKNLKTATVVGWAVAGNGIVTGLGWLVYYVCTRN